MRRILFGMVWLVVVCSSVNAAPIKWTIVGMTFDDGGTGSGSFIYDADTDTVSAVSILTSGGSAFGGAVYSLPLTVHPAASVFPHTFSFLTDNVSGVDGENSLGFSWETVAGETILVDTTYLGIPILSSEGICRYEAYLGRVACGGTNRTLRVITGGSLTTTVVPLPGTLSLLLAGLTGLGGGRWLRRKINR